MKGTPFFFDENVFDEDGVRHEKEDTRPPKPEFTHDDLDAAKAIAFEEGRKAGLKDSDESKTKDILTLFQKIERDMSVLFAAENDRNKTYENESVHLSLKILEKIFPLYAKEIGLDELEKTLHATLQTATTPENILIELNNDIASLLEPKLKEMGVALHKNISIKPNSVIARLDCKITWPEGGILCNTTTIAEKTFAIMHQALAERGVSVHDEDSNPQSEDGISTEENIE